MQKPWEAEFEVRGRDWIKHILSKITQIFQITKNASNKALLVEISKSNRNNTLERDMQMKLIENSESNSKREWKPLPIEGARGRGG